MLYKGQVKNYNTERGFGFIRPENGVKDLFFHIRDFPTGDAPQVAERVSYLVEQNGDKLAAKNISRLDVTKSEIPAVHEWQIQPTAASHAQADGQRNTHLAESILRNKFNPHVLSPRPLKQKRPNKPISRILALVLTFVCVFVLGSWGFKYFQNHQNLTQQQTLAETTFSNNNNVSNRSASKVDLYAAIQAPPRILEPPKSTTNANVVVNTTSSGASNFSCDGRTHCSQMHSYAEAVWFLNHCPGTQMDGNSDGEPCEQQFGRGH